MRHERVFSFSTQIYLKNLLITTFDKDNKSCLTPYLGHICSWRGSRRCVVQFKCRSINYVYCSSEIVNSTKLDSLQMQIEEPKFAQFQQILQMADNVKFIQKRTANHSTSEFVPSGDLTAWRVTWNVWLESRSHLNNDENRFGWFDSNPARRFQENNFDKIRRLFVRDKTLWDNWKLIHCAIRASRIGSKNCFATKGKRRAEKRV